MRAHLLCCTSMFLLVVLLFFDIAIATAEPTNEFGRVFLSAAERAKLNKQREEFYAAPDIQPIDPVPVAIKQNPEPISDEKLGPALLVNGFVKRAETSGTVWINGESTYDGDMANLNVNHLKTKIVGKKVRIAPLDDEAVVYLKPGQGFNPEKQAITSGFGTGADALDSEY